MAITPMPPENDSLRVSIAVPLDGHRRTIKLCHDAPRFNVVIFNLSNEPQKIWAEDCSRGNDNLTLEISAIDDETLPQPMIVERRAFGWLRNIVRGVTLEPGDTTVREVHLHQYQPGERSEGLAFHARGQVYYTGFPRLGETSGVSHVIRMRAVFNGPTGEDDIARGFWSGCIASDMQDYTVWGRYL